LGSIPANEKTYPIKVSLFGLEAIVQVTNPLLHLNEQAGRFQRGSADFMKNLYLYISTVHESINHAASGLQGFCNKRCIVNGWMYQPAFAIYITLAIMGLT
jgi:hypothetical protein